MAKPRQARQRGTNWSSEETSALITFWSEKTIMSIMDSKSKNTHAYQKIADMMEEANHERGVDQIKSKVKFMRQKYQAAKDAISKSGASEDTARKICPHFDELDAFLGTKPLTRPHYMARSSDPTSLIIASGEVSSTDDNAEESTREEPQLESQECDASTPSTPSTSQSNPPSSGKRLRIVVPGLAKRRKQHASKEDDFLQQFVEEDKEARAGLQDVLKKQMEMDAQHYREERELLAKMMEKDDEANRGMMDMMGQMINIIKNSGQDLRVVSSPAQNLTQQTMSDMLQPQMFLPQSSMPPMAMPQITMLYQMPSTPLEPGIWNSEMSADTPTSEANAPQQQ